MTLISAVVILGSVFYIGRIVLEYQSQQAAVLPLLEQMEQEVERLNRQVASEASLKEEMRGRVRNLRDLEDDLRGQIGTMKKELGTEEDRYRKLKVKIQKLLFRNELKRGRKLALR